MNPKNTLPISEARKKIFEIAEEVQKPGVYYVLTEKGRPKVVMLSYEEYDSIIETIEVSQEMPDLDKDIAQVCEDYKSGKHKGWTTLEELLAKQGYVLAEKANKNYGISPKAKFKSRKTTGKNS